MNAESAKNALMATALKADHVSREVAWPKKPRRHFVKRHFPFASGLPDGLFSNQKFQFW
jgi:hypothetical protein